MSTNIEIIIGTYEEFLLGYKYELKVSREKDLKQCIWTKYLFVLNTERKAVSCSVICR